MNTKKKGSEMFIVLCPIITKTGYDREHTTNPLTVILTRGLIYSLFACYNVSVLAIFLYFVQFPHACLAFSLQRSNFLEIFLVFMVLIVSFTVKAS